MSKFPLLNTYRTLAVILAVIILIGGIVSATNTASPFRSDMQFGVFIATFIPILAAAFFLGVVGEMISLALRIEDHLDVMRSIQEKQAGITRKKASTTRPRIDDKRYKSVFDETSESTSLNAVVIQDQTPIFSKPGDTYGWGELAQGKELILVGRTQDSQWVACRLQRKSWVMSENLEIDGDINSLPVLYEAET